MLFTLDGKPIIDMSISFQLVDKWLPAFPSHATRDESVCISDHNQDIPRPRHQDIQTLGSRHEAYISISIASGQ